MSWTKLLLVGTRNLNRLEGTWGSVHQYPKAGLTVVGDPKWDQLQNAILGGRL